MTAPAYTATAYVDNSTAVPLSAANLNKEENQTAALTTALNTHITSHPGFTVTDLGVGGTADDSTAVQAVLTALGTAGGGIAQGRPNTTYTCQDLTVPSGVTVQGAGWNTIFKQKLNAADNHYLFSVNPGTGGSTDPTTNVVNVAFRDCQLLGTVATDAFLQHQYLLNLNAVTNVRCSNVLFKGWRGDAIYLGSSNSAATERHNLDIDISRCTFDGVSQDNRSAITIQDGQRVRISNCTFLNTTRTDMPGAINIDVPSGNTFGRVRDIKIADCSFWAVRAGTAGVITLNLHDTQAAYTLPMEGLSILGCDFHDCTGSNALIYLAQNQTPATTTRENGVLVRDCRGYTIKPYDFTGVRGVTCRGNSFENVPKVADLGFGNPVRDMTFAGESYKTVTGATGLSVYRATDLTYIDCDLIDFSITQGFRFALDSGATGASDRIKFVGLRMRGTVPTNTILKDAAHTATPANNTAVLNDWSTSAQTNLPDVFGGSLIASTDAPSMVLKTVSATTYTFIASDAGKMILFTAATAVTATVPASVFVAGQQIATKQRGAGQVTHAAGAGFTLTAQGAAFKTTGQYAAATLTFLSATTADLDGNTTV